MLDPSKRRALSWARRVAPAALAALLTALPGQLAEAAEWPDLSAPAAASNAGARDAAVIVGVESYVFLPPVPGALQNAQDWYLYLTRSRGVPISRVALLKNSEATREAMEAAATRAAAQVEPRGTLWFIFVGHGAAASKDGLLIGADTQQTADSVGARGLPQRRLLALLEKGAQAQTTAILDACFSGRTSDGKPLVEGLQPLVLAGALDAAAIPARQAVLTAAKSDQFAGPLPGLGRPAFSYLVLGALRGWGDRDRDGTVTAREAHEYATEALTALLVGRTQTPDLSAREPGRALVSGAAERGPDLGAFVMERKSELSFAGGLSVRVPEITIRSASGLRDLNVAVEQKLDEAIDTQQSKTATPAMKAEQWCALGKMTKDNPYLVQATDACAAWTTYAASLDKLERAVADDYQKLSAYLALRHKDPQKKLAALDAFLTTYQPATAHSRALSLRVAIVTEAQKAARAGTFGELPASEQAMLERQKQAEQDRIAAEQRRRDEEQRRIEAEEGKKRQKAQEIESEIAGRRSGIVLTSIAGAAAAGMGVSLGVWAATHARLQDKVPFATLEDAESAASRVGASRTAALYLGAGTVLFAAIGIPLIVTGRSPEKASTPKVSLSGWVGGDVGGVVARGAW